MHATIKTDDQFKTNEKFTKRVDSEQKLLAKIHIKISKMHKKGIIFTNQSCIKLIPCLG